MERCLPPDLTFAKRDIADYGTNIDEVTISKSVRVTFALTRTSWTSLDSTDAVSKSKPGTKYFNKQ